ncbi:putative glutathione-specific gamma-glutamylcyclotransferase 2 [Ostrea edulis]|uniref:putative glutathione-specific gamma-glutamylcyclotransferase 2 n=1 Tax=Ostrea edulis TaxID=37623 RepID=UPI0024AF091C|nr:putative glutathione-specific gamma-glutamylcyclotransferase 2 [Ostrea edulis]
MMSSPNKMGEGERLEIFGYGSLVWKHDFNFAVKENGYIKGYQRKFWQQNKTHRGTPDQPGRVAILHETHDEDKVWGTKFSVVGAPDIQEAREKLNIRETVLGGYISTSKTFYSETGAQCSVLLFTATKDNDLYVGPISSYMDEDIEHIAEQVIRSCGFAGTNAEYVIKLADFVRNNFPQENDEHLFLLDKRVKEKMKENR